MKCTFVGLIKTIIMHSTCIEIQLIPQREHNPSPLEISAGWYCRSLRKYSLPTARIIHNTYIQWVAKYSVLILHYIVHRFNTGF